MSTATCCYTADKSISPQCVVAPNGDIWCITSNTYDSTQEGAVRAGIQNEFGSNAIPLDWRDLQNYYNTYGHLDILREIPFNVKSRPYGGITVDGTWGDYPYFAEEEGKYYNSNFGVYDSIGPGEGPHGYDLLDLGKWYGTRGYYVKIPS
jgi:hypothetical protein